MTVNRELATAAKDGKPLIPSVLAGSSSGAIGVVQYRAAGRRTYGNLCDDCCANVVLIRPEHFDPKKPWNSKLPLSDFHIVMNTLNSFMSIQETLMEYAFHRAASHGRSRVFSYLPDLRFNYNIFDFGSGKAQMEETEKWASLPESRVRALSSKSPAPLPFIRLFFNGAGCRLQM